VTGGTLAGTTATATITPGQTTTLTFINDPTTAIVPPAAPPPVQFFPASPPPPAAAPPPPPPLAAPPVTAAAPGAPVIPESESVALLAVGLATVGGLAVLRRRWPIV
jgi:hypothetical protein